MSTKTTTGRTTKPKQATKGTKAKTNTTKTSKAPVKDIAVKDKTAKPEAIEIIKPKAIDEIHSMAVAKRSRGNPAMLINNDKEDTEKQKKKMLILAKLNELEHRRGIAKFNSAEEMQGLIESYFNDCVELEIRPTIRGLASALGTVYSTLNDWENGSRDGILGNSGSLVIKKAKQFIAEYDEMLAVEGVDNPILFMFRAKNYYGMRDLQDIQLTASNALQPTMSMQEIADKVAKDVVIDTDYSE
jgi:hypothetical protein